MKPRLTLVENIYHSTEEESDQPLVVATSAYRWLETSEQPWSRKLTVGPEWQRVCNGSWLTQSSLMGLRNDDKEAVLEVGIHQGNLLTTGPDKALIGTISTIHPGLNIRLEPVGNLDQYVIRSRTTPAKVSITLLPV